MTPPVMPTRILVLGSGGREHALAWKLAAEPGVNEVVVAPGSDGIATLDRVRCVAVDPLDRAAVVAVAARDSAELVVIGPEGPLAAGVADALGEAGIAVFGPTAAAARIETSKAFCHAVAAAAGVPMARSVVARSRLAALDAARAFLAESGAVVVKDDGLAGGKGVTVFGPGAEPMAGLEIDLERRFAASAGVHPGDVAGEDRPVLIEERLAGREASVIAICDGRDALALPPARDYKRLADGDAGPNTGGMGAYSPLPDLPDGATDAIIEAFHRPILAELARRGIPFRGALYAGLMLTADGPRLLECNARFGDPETQVVLPRLGVALGPLLAAAARGELAAAGESVGLVGRRLPPRLDVAVGVVLAAAGYPQEPRRDDPIAGLGAAAMRGALVFHAGTRRAADGGWQTAGGRVVTLVARAADHETARAVVEDAASAVTWPGLQRRRDIAAERPVSVAGAMPAGQGAVG